MYIAELRELVSVESQLSDALLRMAGAAAHPAPKDLLLHHRGETEAQKERLATILRKHGANPAAHTDQAMHALVHETRKMLAMLGGGDLRDAGLIASAQKLEHYKIAAYGTAAALAGQLDLWICATSRRGCCACRKSNTHIQMMKSAKKWLRQNATNGMYRSRRRRVLVD
jgi:ferritin-like metal-binding protein YciE